MPQEFLDQDLIVRRMFYPRRELGESGQRAQIITVTVDPGVRVGGRCYSVDPAAPMLLFFHGNGELATDYDFVAEFFLRAGVSLLVMDYRGYGISGGEPSSTNLLRDSVTIFDELHQALAPRGQNAPTFVMGRSLGSAAALELADKRREKLAGVIIESGFAFTKPLLARLGLPLEGFNEERDGFGNALKISRYAGPTLIIHGECDTLIAPAQAIALYESSVAREKHLVIVPKAGHNDLMLAGSELYFEALRTFIAASCCGGGSAS